MKTKFSNKMKPVLLFFEKICPYILNIFSADTEEAGIPKNILAIGP